MAAGATQLVLGTFVMTIVHCLLALSAIGWRGSQQPMPFFTMTVAIVLSLISVGLLVLHLHVLARSIMSETVIARVGRELDASLDALGEIEPEPSDPEGSLRTIFTKPPKDDGEAPTILNYRSTSGHLMPEQVQPFAPHPLTVQSTTPVLSSR